MKPIKKSRTFAFDFDGVIAEYDGNFVKGKAGKPIKNVIEAIKKLRKQGHKILIYSTRNNSFLKKYCKKYNLTVDYINDNPNYDQGNKGKPVASVYLDDRAMLYKGQDTETIVRALNNFKVYYQK
jgi:hydroxymethylpyrimidine pyrophosphatase-like HAD family hydrolase